MTPRAIVFAHRRCSLPSDVRPRLQVRRRPPANTAGSKSESVVHFEPVAELEQMPDLWRRRTIFPVEQVGVR
jgi:hypothetical protein